MALGDTEASRSIEAGKAGPTWSTQDVIDSGHRACRQDTFIKQDSTFASEKTLHAMLSN